VSHKLKPVRQQNTQNHVNAINGLAPALSIDICARAIAAYFFRFCAASSTCR